MSDEHDIERAEQHQEFLTQNAIAERRAKVPRGMGPEYCDCGNEIPQKRRELGYHRCITCAEVEDRRHAQYRR